MKKLLNILYVLTQDSYLFCRNETIAINVGGEEKMSVPAHNIDAIVSFGQNSFSTALIGFCAEKGITVTFLSPTGKFYARVCGPVSGNVLLRKAQYKAMDDSSFSLSFVRDLLYCKINNSKTVLLRYARNTENTQKQTSLITACNMLSEMAKQLSDCKTIDSMRGVEGAAASVYFARFDNMLNAKDPELKFETRSRRPPRNEVNAALSFTYTLLTREVQSALETAGLDPAAGFLHTLRPGRMSFALDLMEELRSPLCDCFVISLFNKGQLSKKDFETNYQEVYLNDKGRRTLISAWQKRKETTIIHPFLNEKVQIGIIPHTQAMLFARVLRGDLDRYPPFVWR